MSQIGHTGNVRGGLTDDVVGCLEAAPAGIAKELDCVKRPVLS